MVELVKGKFLKCLLKIIGKNADTKSANKNRHHFGCLFSIASDFINALSIQLRTSRDVVVDHEQVQVFFAVFLVDGADDHAAGIDAHHGAWWQIGDGDQSFADEFFRFVVFVDAGENGAVFTCAVVQGELKELFALWHGFAIQYLNGTEVALGEGFEVDHVFEKWFDFNAGEVDFFVGGFFSSGFCFLLGSLFGRCTSPRLHGYGRPRRSDSTSLFDKK